MKLVLWSYWRSSASYRVRIALHLKGLAYEYRAVDLLRDEQADPAYRATHPQALVPALEVDGRPIVQSLAILEWLEETFPEPPLLPRDPFARARVRAFALAIACEIHPLSNLAVRRFLKEEWGLDEAAQTRWHHRWLEAGLGACEAMVRSEAGPFCFGDRPTIADCLLVPQLYNARRYGFALDPFVRLREAEEAMRALEPVRRAAPEAQPDAPKS
ncbi:MAG: maleylacetoacetate isomerase [Geminicoccaceae bacterium]|nr:maleylacetoacetate isomerase [Geminicoccaceae bacterium]MCX7631004.1 maleylacetoacetate isomerase [Geminicoccaceae bacterium]MDW8125450.1 maleylacetoacetate isomerase [Geminicoccaceae bacterium]